MSSLENVHRHMACKEPPVAVLPLGTGNDLARILGFGSGWNGEGVAHVLHQVIEKSVHDLEDDFDSGIYLDPRGQTCQNGQVDNPI